MKKSVLIFVLITLIAAGAFAQDSSISIPMSIGWGFVLDNSSGNGVKGTYIGQSFRQKNNNLSYGVNLFFDMHYAELEMTFAESTITSKYRVAGRESFSDAGTTKSLSFSLLGKYPISVGPVILFPLFGISYNLVLATHGPRAFIYEAFP